MAKDKELAKLDVKDRGSSTVLGLVSLGVGFATAGVVNLPVDDDRYEATAKFSDGSSATATGSSRTEATEKATKRR
ncbi:MAG: hypothetical protein ACYCZU_13505 [Devosia sp.]